MRYYLEEKMTRNAKDYDRFMRLKLGFEEIDMKLAGMASGKMTYKDIVHYRTFAGERGILRYATLKGEFDLLYLESQRKFMWRAVDTYNNRSLPPGETSVYDSMKFNMEADLERKRAAYLNRFFRKV